MGVREFYAKSHWGTQWNVVDSAHPNGHRGHDLKWADGTSVPALRGGKAVTTSYSSALGYYVVVQVSDGSFDYYCHLKFAGRPALGAVLSQGSKIGALAGLQDRHGSAWKGSHLHYGNGPFKTSVTAGVTNNATMIIQAVLSGTASGSETAPLNNKENDMTTYVLRNVGASAQGIDAGATFIGDGVSPLVWVANPGPETITNKIPVSEWDVAAIVKRITEVGIRGSGENLNKVYKSMADARANKPPVYTL